MSNTNASAAVRHDWIIRERRPDGWALCPICGEDEVMSLLAADPRRSVDDSPSIAELEAGALRCIACGWHRPEGAGLSPAQAAAQAAFDAQRSRAMRAAGLDPDARAGEDPPAA